MADNCPHTPAPLRYEGFTLFKPAYIPVGDATSSRLGLPIDGGALGLKASHYRANATIRRNTSTTLTHPSSSILPFKL